MQRVCYSSGMRPDDFWSATLDECILTYKGKVDDWRVMRAGFNLIHCSLVEKPVDISKVIPLPFDEDSGEVTEDLIEEYKRLGGVINEQHT